MLDAYIPPTPLLHLTANDCVISVYVDVKLLWLLISACVCVCVLIRDMTKRDITYQLQRRILKSKLFTIAVLCLRCKVESAIVHLALHYL